MKTKTLTDFKICISVPLNSKSYPIIIPDVFPLAFQSGSIAIRYASYHFQNWSVPTPLRYKNHTEKNMFQWKQKAHPI